jgi:geranylgeranyl pyrophosphate synthase
MLTAEIFGTPLSRSRPAAVAVELLHDFTLVHDDVMDNDAIRRGQPTVHTKWDVSTAILAGDGLMGLAFQKLLASPCGNIPVMLRRMTETMIEVCEGQALDKMFETAGIVSSEAYLDMINRKTAALIAFSCELGGLLAGVAAPHLQMLTQFGRALGLAFQIQDDLLDVTADPEKLGKPVGSDLAMRKQNILTILLYEKQQNSDFFHLSLDEFRLLLQSSGALEQAQDISDQHLNAARSLLQQMPDNGPRQHLADLVGFLCSRQW